MKFLLALLLTASLSVIAQPVQRNSFTTNTTGLFPALLPVSSSAMQFVGNITGDGTIYGSSLASFTDRLFSFDNLTVTNGLTNLSLTASANLVTDANKKVVSLANGTGALTNNGSGVMGWFNSFITSAALGSGIATNGGSGTGNTFTNPIITGSTGATYTNLTEATGKTVISGPTTTATITNGPTLAKYGLDLTNSNPAVVGGQMWSPFIHLAGNGWKTTATAGSQPVEFTMGVQPIQGTANPTGALVISNIINNAAPVELVRFQSDSSMRMPQTGTILFLGVNNNGVQVNSGGAVQGWGATQLILGSQGSATIRMQVNGVDKWLFNNNASFDFYPFADNGSDIGNATPNRVRTIHLGTSLTNSSAAGGTGMNFPAAGTGTDGAAAADLKINSAVGTGTGRGGAIRLQTANSATSTGSTANSLTDRTYLSAKRVSLTESTATLVFNASLASGKTCGLRIFATTDADDGTDFQTVAETVHIAAVNKGGTVSTGTPQVSGSTVNSSGTLTTSWTAVANGNGVDVKCNAVSSLTQTTLATRWRVELDSDDTAISITAQ